MMTISPYILKKLNRHIDIYKSLIDKSTSKKTWVNKAVKEKLENDLKDEQIPKHTSLSVKIDKGLHVALMDRVNFIRKFRESYSKKQWIVEAVLEKLEREEKEVEKKGRN
jgi:hypothetical protein